MMLTSMGIYNFQSLKNYSNFSNNLVNYNMKLISLQLFQFVARYV